MMNAIDLIGADVSADELDLMPFEHRDAVESVQEGQEIDDALRLVDDPHPPRPGVIRHR